MLVLGRRVAEKIVIADRIEITILEIRGRTVRLGFTAPPDVAIHREEISRRLAAERAGTGEQRAAGTWELAKVATS
jgi:carbon storage regulator